MTWVDVKHRLEVAPWLLEANDDAPAGRLVVEAGCGGCGERRRLLLPAGTWSVEHKHGGRWTAHLVALAPAAPPPPTPLDVAALAAGLAEALTLA